MPFAVARDGYFFSALADVHPRFHTPSVAIVFQAVLSIVLLLLGGNFRQLFSLAIFAEWLFYMIAGSTIFVFRWRDPQAARPYRVFGYPFVPALFILVAAVLLCLYLPRRLAEFFLWIAGDSCRRSGVRVVPAPQGYCLITGYPPPPSIFGIIELSVFWPAKSAEQRT